MTRIFLRSSLCENDLQISLTDPDARSMATSGRGSGMVGYNVQSAVVTEHHLIVTHEVTKVGSLVRKTDSNRTSRQVRKVPPISEVIRREVPICGRTVFLAAILATGLMLQPALAQTPGTPTPTFIQPSSTSFKPLFIEPYVAAGGTFSSLPGNYNSTGGQLAHESLGYVQEGSIDWGFSYGFDSNLIGYDIGAFLVEVEFDKSFPFGNNRLFAIPRHAGGDVTLEDKGSTTVDLQVEAVKIIGDLGGPVDEHFYADDGKMRRIKQNPLAGSLARPVAREPERPVFLTFGIGPSFRYSTLGLTSDQRAFGGGIPSTTQSQWLVGLVTSVGVSTWVCRTCVGGNPLDVGLEARMRYFGSQSVSLTSPAFGFIETARVGSHPEFSLRLKVGVPIMIR